MTEKHRITIVERNSMPLYPTGFNSIREIRKAIFDAGFDSRQRARIGEQQHPIDFGKAIELMPHNAHHETCIRTKRDATVGLGFVTEFDKVMEQGKLDPEAGVERAKGMDRGEPSKPEEVLNPLCDTTLQDLLNDVGEDYENTGNGYIEVVRENGAIVSLWHCPTTQVHVFVEDGGSVNRHFKFVGVDGSDRRFARFGDLDNFLTRDNGGKGLTIEQKEQVSELIHFRSPTARSRWYGLPNWLSAVPSIELVQMLHQQQFDFFLNRGVPEFMALFLGTQIDKDTWETIENGVKATIGSGNAHKTMALNITDPQMRVQIEKLALEGKTENSFKELSEASAMEIVTAHRVPPLLAGIQIPGKLGAVNELPNALIAFQTLHVDQQQKLFQDTLGSTLGEDPSIPLTRSDFTFRKITDQFNLQGLDTMSRMRESAVQAAEQNRDLDEGVKKAAVDPEEIGRSLGRLLLAAQAVA